MDENRSFLVNIVLSWIAGHLSISIVTCGDSFSKRIHHIKKKEKGEEKNWGLGGGGEKKNPNLSWIFFHHWN